MTATDARPEDFDETSVPALWETARWFLRWLYAMCGGPAALAAEPWLSSRRRREIAVWLRPVEALLRRLLVVEAARIAQAAGQRKVRLSGKDRRAGRPRPAWAFFRPAEPENPEDPASWRVRFTVPGWSVAARNPAARSGPRARDPDTLADVLAPAALAVAAAQARQRIAEQNAPDPGERGPDWTRVLGPAGNPRPLSRRIEALLRVALDPHPYARRLARRLRRNPASLLRACRKPPPRRPGRRSPYGHEALRHASDHALQALAAFDTG